MRSQKTTWPACALALALLARCGHSQTLPQITTRIAPQTTQDALHELAQQAEVIFSGQVAAIRHHDRPEGGAGIVEIDFAIEDAIRGDTGGVYTLREWAGIWQTGDEPFSVGRHYLMLLHAPGPSGLSSPIGGMDGAIPIRGSSQTTRPSATRLRESETAALATQGDSRVIDLRWIGTRVARPVSYRPESVARQTALPVSVRAYAITQTVATVGESESGASGAADLAVSSAIVQATPSTTPSAPQFTPYPAMLAILRAWEKSDDAAH